MKRSIWKVPYISPLLFKFKENNNFKSFSSNSYISNFFSKKTILIYSGRHWIKVNIDKAMVGCKMGEFSLSKILGSAISVSMAKKIKAKIKAKASKK